MENYMKILNRSIGISHGQLKQLNLIKNIDKQPKNSTKDSTVITSYNAKDIFHTRTHQIELRQYEQADKLLSDLLKNIKNLQDQPSVLYKNIKETAESLEKKYPQFTSRLNKIPMNMQQLTTEINAIKKEIDTNIQNQRKILSHYLIMEQNKDSISKTSVNNQMISLLKKEIKAQPIKMHSNFSQSISRLLSDN